MSTLVNWWADWLSRCAFPLQRCSATGALVGSERFCFCQLCSTPRPGMCRFPGAQTYCLLCPLSLRGMTEPPASDFNLWRTVLSVRSAVISATNLSRLETQNQSCLTTFLLLCECHFFAISPFIFTQHSGFMIELFTRARCKKYSVIS